MTQLFFFLKKTFSFYSVNMFLSASASSCIYYDTPLCDRYITYDGSQEASHCRKQATLNRCSANKVIKIDSPSLRLPARVHCHPLSSSRWGEGDNGGRHWYTRHQSPPPFTPSSYFSPRPHTPVPDGFFPVSLLPYILESNSCSSPSSAVLAPDVLFLPSPSFWSSFLPI